MADQSEIEKAIHTDAPQDAFHLTESLIDPKRIIDMPNRISIDHVWQNGLNALEQLETASQNKDRDSALAAYERLMIDWTHPDVARVMDQLATQYHTDLQSLGAAFIPGGSTGGWFTLFIKELAGTYPPTGKARQDLDLFLASDYRRRDDYIRVDQLLKSAAQTLATDQIFCAEGNAHIGNYSPTPIPNINAAQTWHESAPQDAQATLLILEGDPYLARYLANYFFPSFPPEINMTNRSLMLEALSTLPKDRAHAIANTLLTVFADEAGFPAIKAKYFGLSTDDATARPALTELNRAFIQIRLRAVSALLNSAITE